MTMLLPCPGKEYSKGDSRYVARDTATVTVEGITAVLAGPASLLAVYDSLLISSQAYKMHYLYTMLQIMQRGA
jgi:cholestenol delta-isomerase